MIKKSDTCIEVEEKFYLPDNSSQLIEKISGAGYSQNEDEYEVDEYFTDHEGEFIKNRTCLRIRTKRGQSEITFKGKSRFLSGFYAKAEHNLPLPVAVVSEYKKLFNSLGYYKYVTVAKQRQNFSRQEKGLIYNIAIDTVENVGAFAELEILAPSHFWHGKEKALEEEMRRWIGELSAQDWQKATLPYRDFTALSIKEKIFKAPRLKALLLDFDGTIVRSEELFFRAFREAAIKYFNYQISEEEYKEKELYDSEGLFAYLSKQTDNYEIRKDDLMAEVYNNYDSYFNALLADENSLTNLRAFKDLKNIGYKLALVTTSKRQFVERLLKAADAGDLFDALITREDVSEKKPSPAGFNLALKRLVLQPEECLVIEDSPRGIAAAKAASIDCVGVYENSLINREELEALNIPVFEGVKEIIYILRYAQ